MSRFQPALVFCTLMQHCQGTTEGLLRQVTRVRIPKICESLRITLAGPRRSAAAAATGQAPLGSQRLRRKRARAIDGGSLSLCHVRTTTRLWRSSPGSARLCWASGPGCSGPARARGLREKEEKEREGERGASFSFSLFFSPKCAALCRPGLPGSGGRGRQRTGARPGPVVPSAYVVLCEASLAGLSLLRSSLWRSPETSWCKRRQARS